MIKASEARAKAKINDPVNVIKNSDEFKYVMQKLEFEITNAANNGKYLIGSSIDAQHGNWPSSDFLDAIVSELQDNGYTWKLMRSPITSNLNIIICWDE